jgi:large subunit ribosomal protein LP0
LRSFPTCADYLSLASVFIVNVDNVGSNQMHQIRVALRGKGVVLMGKNTMVRRALRSIISEYPQLERLLPHVRGNIGFVFTSSDLPEIRGIITANKVAAPARAGALAPRDVLVPGGNTGMEPGKTSFFQALGIPTKIARGTIEIVSDVKVVTAGTRVGPSEATLLNMLNISPFTYGMTVVQIFDQGNVFPPDVLDVSTDELVGRFMTGVKTIAALSLALNYPTIASVSHSLVNAYKNLLAIALGTDYSFEGAEKVVCCTWVFFPTPLKLGSRSKNISRIPKHSPLLPRLLLRLRLRTLLLPPPRRKKKRRIRMMTWSVSVPCFCLLDAKRFETGLRSFRLIGCISLVRESHCSLFPKYTLSNDQKYD